MAQGTFHATDEEPIDEVVRMDEEVVRADVVTFLARRTRTLGRCSFDARSRRRTTSARREVMKRCYADPIRCRDNDHKHCNWLKRQCVSLMFQENRWRVIRTEIGRSGSYEDQSSHCYAANQLYR